MCSYPYVHFNAEKFDSRKVVKRHIKMKSGLNSLRCVTLPVAFATIVLTMVVFFEFAVANLLFESPCGPNKAYRQNILGSAETASSPMECSVLCLDKEKCRSFTYNRGDERCELSSGLERICSLLTVETGSTYYVVVSYATISPFFIFLPRYSNIPYALLYQPFQYWSKTQGIKYIFKNI